MRSPEAVTVTDARRLLGIYLSDHRAGATGGLALVRRMAAAHEGSSWAECLRALHDEISQDAAALEALARANGVPARAPLKEALATVLERVGRLKLNGRLVRRSPLSDVLETEALLAGIDAKASLWRALGAAGVRLPGPLSLTELGARAMRQRDVVGELHRDAARRAFGR